MLAIRHHQRGTILYLNKNATSLESNQFEHHLQVVYIPTAVAPTYSRKRLRARAKMNTFNLIAGMLELKRKSGAFITMMNENAKLNSYINYGTRDPCMSIKSTCSYLARVSLVDRL